MFAIGAYTNTRSRCWNPSLVIYNCAYCAAVLQRVACQLCVLVLHTLCYNLLFLYIARCTDEDGLRRNPACLRSAPTFFVLQFSYHPNQAPRLESLYPSPFLR